MEYDKNGFYPQHPCKKCGTMLDDGTLGRPAELYAGVYNGLCYHCTNYDIYIVKRENLDGAEWFSFPPHCPSWRRYRESFISYPDCGCEHGRVIICRSFGAGGNYPINCEKCLDKYYNHPIRLKHSVRIKKINKIVNELYQVSKSQKSSKKYYKKYARSIVNVKDKHTLNSLMIRADKVLDFAYKIYYEKLKIELF